MKRTVVDEIKVLQYCRLDEEVPGYNFWEKYHQSRGFGTRAALKEEFTILLDQVLSEDSVLEQMIWQRSAL